MNNINENLLTPQKKPGEAVKDAKLRANGNKSPDVGNAPILKTDKGNDKRFARHKGSYGEETNMTAASVIESAVNGEAMDVIDAINDMMRAAAVVAVRGEQIEEDTIEEFSTEGLTEEAIKLYEFATSTLSPSDTYKVEGHINDWRNNIERSQGHLNTSQHHAACADDMHPEKDAGGLIPQHRAAADLHDQLAQVYAGMAETAFAQAKAHVKKLKLGK